MVAVVCEGGVMNDTEQYFDQKGNPVSLETLCQAEPGWAASRIRVMREGARIVADLFSRLTHEQKMAVPPEKAEQISLFMHANGYRLVFSNWYLQGDEVWDDRTTP